MTSKSYSNITQISFHKEKENWDWIQDLGKNLLVATIYEVYQARHIVLNDLYIKAALVEPPQTFEAGITTLILQMRKSTKRTKMTDIKSLGSSMESNPYPAESTVWTQQGLNLLLWKVFYFFNFHIFVSGFVQLLWRSYFGLNKVALESEWKWLRATFLLRLVPAFIHNSWKFHTKEKNIEADLDTQKTSITQQK